MASRCGSIAPGNNHSQLLAPQKYQRSMGPSPPPDHPKQKKLPNGPNVFRWVLVVRSVWFRSPHTIRRNVGPATREVERPTHKRALRPPSPSARPAKKEWGISARLKRRTWGRWASTKGTENLSRPKRLNILGCSMVSTSTSSVQPGRPKGLSHPTESSPT